MNRNPSPAGFTSAALAVLAVITLAGVHVNLIAQREARERDERHRMESAARSPEQAPTHILNLAEKEASGQELWPHETEALNNYRRAH